MSLEDKVPQKAVRAADLVLAAIGILSLGAWTYYLYHYVWTGERQFASGLHIVLFLCLPPVVASLAFLYLPEWERYAAPELVRQNREQVLEVVTDLKIPVIDIHEVFQSHPNVLSLFPLRRSGHYNIEGNAVVAGAILKRLAQAAAPSPLR